MIRPLFQFLSRYPWVFVPLAFLVLIGGWVTIYVLASGIDTSQIPVERPVPANQANP